MVFQPWLILALIELMMIFMLFRLDSEDAVEWAVSCMNGEDAVLAGEGQRITCYRHTGWILIYFYWFELHSTGLGNSNCFYISSWDHLFVDIISQCLVAIYKVYFNLSAEGRLPKKWPNKEGWWSNKKWLKVGWNWP